MEHRALLTGNLPNIAKHPQCSEGTAGVTWPGQSLRCCIKNLRARIFTGGFILTEASRSLQQTTQPSAEQRLERTFLAEAISSHRINIPYVTAKRTPEPSATPTALPSGVDTEVAPFWRLGHKRRLTIGRWQRMSVGSNRGGFGIGRGTGEQKTQGVSKAKASTEVMATIRAKR